MVGPVIHRSKYPNNRAFQLLTGHCGESLICACAKTCKPCNPEGGKMEKVTSSSSATSSPTHSSSSSGVKKQKQQISIVTFSKWQSLYNRDHDSLLWLHCDKDRDNKTSVSTIWCYVCHKYEGSIAGLKNFSRNWIEGSTNHRVSNVLVDHASSSQHKAAMVHFNKEVGARSSSSVSNQ